MFPEQCTGNIPLCPDRKVIETPYKFTLGSTAPTLAPQSAGFRAVIYIRSVRNYAFPVSYYQPWFPSLTELRLGPGHWMTRNVCATTADSTANGLLHYTCSFPRNREFPEPRRSVLLVCLSHCPAVTVVNETYSSDQLIMPELTVMGWTV